LVSRNADGTFTVCSQSERGKTYVINGSCPCPDAQKRQSQCAHLIATWIWRKARKAIEEQFASDATEQQSAEMPKATTPVASSLPEAPASCNVYVSIGGRNVQVTLRDTDEQHMLARLEALLQRFPVVEEPKEPAQQEGWCYQHNVQMKLNHGKRGSWWSHKLPNGQWCNQK
jgi:hypothetical protein